MAKQPTKGKAAPKTAARQDKSMLLSSSKDVGMKPLTATAEEHLPPLPLVFIVVFCSGFLFMFAIRDFMMTGRNIFGDWDEPFLLFTKSTDWFDDSKGWKSTQGGFSAIAKVTTDHNNMGGFFVRKMAGATVAGVQLQKMIPLLFHQTGSQFTLGHFRPILISGAVANLASIAFLAMSLEDLRAAGAMELPLLWMAVMAVESIALFYYAITTGMKRGLAVALKDGKTPSSYVSRIVSRTVLLVTGAVTVFAARDLFFPGTILSFVPRDDIYLEWTNALRHSPPDGSPEEMEHGLEAPLFVGDKFVSQWMALHLLQLCCFKFVSAVGLRYGSDGRGDIQAKMFWTAQCVGNAMVLFLFRLFASAANTASLDVRWHLMALAYETFVIGLYGFF